MSVLNRGTPHNLFGIEDQDYGSSRIAVLPVPYDGTASYRTGTREGPHAMIEASRNIELYSEELGSDISKIGIFTLEEMLPNVSSPDAMVKEVENEVSAILDDSKVPLIIGGEHSISIGAISALARSSNGFSVLHMDAHSDSRDTFMGSKYSHACIAARARELCGSCYSVGVRSIDEGSAKRYDDTILLRKDMHHMSMDEIADRISKNTNDNIYLTVDLDVIDPAEMPSVGTPEPDGLTFHELSLIFSKVLTHKRVIGLDFTELSPIPGMVAPDYLAAKLAYLTIGYAFGSSIR